MARKMKYFYNLTYVARTLTSTASKELDSQKLFREALSTTKYQLEQTLGESDLIGDLGLPPLDDGMDLMKELGSSPGNEGNLVINNFAESVMSEMRVIMKECNRVISTSRRTKKDLRRAIVWNKY